MLGGGNGVEAGSSDAVNGRAQGKGRTLMLDLVIKNARICDGTGAPSFMGSLGVKDGVIRHVGKANGQTADRVLDADGLVLAPGFVDPHTHYDAQIAWDPLLTCSPWHGVTTVIMGNCGVGVAPVKPETREILMQDLVNVEAIPYDVMKAGIDWQWESYGQYLDADRPPRPRHQRGRAGRVHAAAPLRDGGGVVRARGDARTRSPPCGACCARPWKRGRSGSRRRPRAITSAIRAGRWRAATPAATS